MEFKIFNIIFYFIFITKIFLWLKFSNVHLQLLKWYFKSTSREFYSLVKPLLREQCQRIIVFHGKLHMKKNVWSNWTKHNCSTGKYCQLFKMIHYFEHVKIINWYVLPRDRSVRIFMKFLLCLCSYLSLNTLFNLKAFNVQLKSHSY